MPNEILHLSLFHTILRLCGWYIILLKHEICMSGKRYDRSFPEHWIIFPQGTYKEFHMTDWCIQRQHAIYFITAVEASTPMPAWGDDMSKIYDTCLACSVTNYCPNQCWFVMILTLGTNLGTLGKKVQWNLNQNATIFIQANVFENGISKAIIIFLSLYMLVVGIEDPANHTKPSAVTMLLIVWGIIIFLPTLICMNNYRDMHDKTFFMWTHLASQIWVILP